MDDTTFYTLLNMVRRKIEQKRPWRFLLTEYTGNSTAPSDTFATAKTLPGGFIQFPNRDKLKLVATDNTRDVIDLKEIKKEQKWEKQSENGYFFIDINAGFYYLTGTYGKAYSHKLFYCKASTTIAASTEWENVPDDFAPILAFAVAVIDEIGMDYDDINARQASGNAATAQMIESAMIKWDDQLLRGALQL